METSHQYFIAILPPDEVCAEINAVRQDFAEHYDSQKALKVIPHITLKAPFKLLDSRYMELIRWFQGLSFPIHSFQVELKDFGNFDNKHNPVVYVNPVMNPDLRALQKQVIENFKRNYPDIPILENELNFRPHITLAYRDLSFKKFKEAWESYRFKKYSRVFQVSSIQLFQHDGKQWNVVCSKEI